MTKQIPLQQLKINTNRIELLNNMNIYSVRDLVLHFPYRYESIEETPLIDNEKVIIEGVLIDEPKIFYKGRLSRLSFQILYKQEVYKVTLFNRHFLKKNMTKEMPLTIIGKYNSKTKSITASDLRLKPLDEISGITPIYSLKEGITQKSFQGYVKKALNFYHGHIQDEVPTNLLIKHHLIHKELALNLIHFPSNNDDVKEALRYLKYEEFLRFQLTMQYIKLSRKDNLGIKKQFNRQTLDEFIAQLPFELTFDQEQAALEVINDLQKETMMYRFVQGDVGSGKTVVGAIGLYANYLAGYQGAMMAPTEILATQHYRSLIKLFKKIDINIALLTGHLSNKEKQRIYNDLENGTIDIVVGTHALFQEKVIYQKLGLVITDEQHRFGVRQREMLAQKGEEPHVLVMTATPIPRTLALILYGDLDISTINELPPGRQKVDTFAVNHTYDNRLYAFIEKEVAKGRQCYIICPMIEENEKLDLRSVLKFTEELKNDRLPDLRVECMHGKLKNNEKQDIMDRFSSGEIDVLVSTTVIEVGVNVPNATLMIIENAERFGLSALHQLRGRVGRGGEKSYCVLVTDSKTKVAKERMSIMCKSNDGFVISEKDLHLRGPGDFFGTRQHGLPEMKIANLYKDINILKDVQSVAIDLYKSDENLEKKENLLLKKRIEELYSEENKKICL